MYNEVGPSEMIMHGATTPYAAGPFRLNVN